MWLFEKKFKVRGIKFYFIVKPEIQKNERLLWKNAISKSSPLCNYFQRIDVGDFSSKGMDEWKNWKMIKIFCYNSSILLKPSDIEQFYNKIFVEFSDWFIKFCKNEKVECRAYDFRIIFRISPLESPTEFIPIPSLKEISLKVVSPTDSLPNPPKTTEEMLQFARKITPLNSKGFDATLNFSKKGIVYSSFGLRNEKDANTYELEMIIPTERTNCTAKGKLKGKLVYNLILETKNRRDVDFNKTIRLLLKKLEINQIISVDTGKNILNKLDDYITEGAIGKTTANTRFVFTHEVMDVPEELRVQLDLTKKQFQKELKNTKYSLYGVVSYELTDDDLDKIKDAIKEIVYFQNMKQDDLSINLHIELLDNSYEKIIAIIKKTDKILNSAGILDIKKSPNMATDLEDAKNRYNVAISDFKRDFKLSASTNTEDLAKKGTVSFIFLREVRGIPLLTFLRSRKLLYNGLYKIAKDTSIRVTLTSDVLFSSTHGCYIHVKPQNL